jgi:hypothetical protein
MTREDRKRFILSEIRREHAAVLRLVPALFEETLDRMNQFARAQATWETVATHATELRCLCAELEGLESAP